MVPRETSQFLFPESPDVSRDAVEGSIRTKLFPSGPYIHCIIVTSEHRATRETLKIDLFQFIVTDKVVFGTIYST